MIYVARVEFPVESRADPIHLVEAMMAKCSCYSSLHHLLHTLFHLPG